MKNTSVKMSFKIMPEVLLKFTEISTCLTLCWPPLTHISKSKILLMDCLCFISFLSSILLLLPLLNSVYHDWNDPLIMSKSICLSCAVSQVSMKIAVCRIQRHRFQALLFEMITFLKEANGTQRRVLQYFVNKHVILHIMLSVGCFLTALIFVCGPFLLSTPLPTDAKYPFSINSSIVYVIYLHQSTVAFQVSSGMTIDCLCASLLWYTAARFKLLATDFQNIKNENDIYQNIRQHQNLLNYAKNVKLAIRFLVFSTMITSTIGVVFASVHLFTPESLMIKAQFGFIICSAGALLFITTWPAEYVISTSTEVGSAVFSSSWVELPPTLLRCYILVLKVSYTPVTINIAGILPNLSLHYYCHFVSKVFSYLATLKVVMSSKYGI